jgi:flagellar hook-basal body complex protein FliE
MIAPITAPSLALPGIEGGAKPHPSSPLADAFSKALEDASKAEHTSTQAAEAFAKGDPNMGIHEVMIAAEKANISVRYATTLKNKALEAYRELMNTQV